ncbi:hypothetical protein NP493_391g01007 [Ridgeia piscesae]|uniref:Vacuolar protein sorting-associated protein VTA1 n=1 Tax=Ridgeia piscesae TaxID=27915 RepID=A0AAD9NSW8_RIDPI|nr:hypothetical protein NP493_391g01007 [Ridgeia piscesae]
MALPAVPASLKPIQHYVKTAVEYDARDPAVSYYCRLYAVQRGMELDKKSPQSRTFLASLMDVMEQEKKLNADNEAIQNEVVGQAHMENAALQMFLYADNEDRAGKFGKNVVKAFYTAGMLFDVLTTFGDLSEDLEKNRKYAKWKAAYIHKCLKNGETPVPGPVADELVEPPLHRNESHESGGFNLEPGPSNNVPTPGGHDQQPADDLPKVNPLPQYNPLPQIGVTAPSLQQLPQSRDTWVPPPNPAGVKLSSDDYQKAMKFSRYANSAMQYEDSASAIENLTKALNILTTGHE